MEGDNASIPAEKPFENFYPPIIENLYEIVFDQNDNPVEEIAHPPQAIANPYRTLARFADAHRRFNDAKASKGYRITYRDEIQYFLDDAKILEAFLQELRANGKDDPVIDWLLSEPFPTDTPKSAREFLAEQDF